MSKSTLLILLIVSAAIMGFAYYMRINKVVPAEVAQQMLKGHNRVIVDVRTPEEFKDGHLTDATNVPLNELETRIVSVVTDKKTPVLLYCRSGARSGSALEILHRLGYENAVNLGSYDNARQQIDNAVRTVQ